MILILGAAALTIAIFFSKLLWRIPGSHWFWPYGRIAVRVVALASSGACALIGLVAKAIIPNDFVPTIAIIWFFVILVAAIHDFTSLGKISDQPNRAKGSPAPRPPHKRQYRKRHH